MRYDCSVLVMRRAPMIGRPTSAPRISVYHRANNLGWALVAAVGAMETDARRGHRAIYWIVKAGQPAHGATEYADAMLKAREAPADFPPLLAQLRTSLEAEKVEP